MTESTTQTKERSSTDSGTAKSGGFDPSYGSESGSGQPTQTWETPQSVIDSMFPSIVGAPYGFTQQHAFTQRIADAYFEQAEHSIHMARRIADMQALSMIQDTIVQQCTGQVTQHLLRNPQILVSALRQAGWTGSSGTPSSR